jgi:ABC-2 type transport system ATP-binding protein
MREDAALTAPTYREEAVRAALVDFASPAPLVSFQGVWRHWGRGKNRWPVLRDVNLDVPAGTAISVAGGNGAGKTTLLRIATGILAPDSGSVTIDGLTADGDWREYHRRIGFLSAGDRGLYARLTVRRHLEYWASLAFMPRADRKAAVDDALDRFGLAELAQRRADRLSQGQRQRLRLALTVLHRPQVLFLDEPRNSLDADGLEVLTSTVGELLAGGGSVMWCSPLGEEQPMTFDRTLAIEGGELRPA